MAGRKKKKKHTFLKILLGFTIFVLICGAIGFAGLYVTGIGPEVAELYADAKKNVSTSNKNTFKSSLTSIVYDTNDQEIASLKGDKGIYYLESGTIPTYVKNAFISIEDKKFYSHNGIDIKAIARALSSILRNKSITQGGSTITQQLSRNIFLTHKVSWQRKVEEIFIALELEKIYTKAEILEFYINNIYFSGGYYGIQAASMGYFSTDVHNLTLSQIAFLCAIPNNPTLYDPIDNMENTLGRRDRILKQMHDDGKITDDEYNNALNETIILNVAEKKSVKYNYAETYIYHCATKALMEHQGFTFRYYFNSAADKEAYEQEYNTLYDECQNSLYTGGYRIYTSMDMDMEQQLQTAIDDQLYAFVSVNDEGIFNMQSAATCIDNKTGYVVAIVGGRSQETDIYTLNRAYQSFRQPGSAIKPLIVYGPAFERGYSPETMVVDEPIEDGPSNYGGGYSGSMDIRTAIKRSINTVAWKLFDEITPKIGLQYLKEMNFAKIDDLDYRNASALGGFTNGVSSLEMAAGYAAIANNGKYRQPTCIKKITTSNGDLVYQNENEEKQIYKESAAVMLTDTLKSVMTEGTGRSLKLSEMPTAGKTGTTNDNKDGWFAGFSKYYTTSVWVGCDMPREVEGLTGSSYPGIIWQEFMESIHTGLTPIDFTPYVKYNSVEKYPSPEETENSYIDDIEDENNNDTEPVEPIEPIDAEPEPDDNIGEELPEE